MCGGGGNSGCEREKEGRNGGRDCLHQFGMYSLERMLCAFQRIVWKLHYLHFSIQLGKNVVCFEKMMIVFECKIWEGCFVCSVYNNN